MRVKQLRQSGYKVRVMHMRNKSDVGYDPHGGTTRVEITTPEGKELVGEARCSNQDNYSKKIGVAIALGRAFKNV